MLKNTIQGSKILVFSLAVLFVYTMSSTTPVYAANACTQYQALQKLREHIQGKVTGTGKTVRDVVYETKLYIPPESDNSGRCSQYWNEYVVIRRDYVKAYIENQSNYKSLAAEGKLASAKYKSCFDAQVKYAKDRIDNAHIHPALDEALYSLGIKGYKSFKSAHGSLKGRC